MSLWEDVHKVKQVCRSDICNNVKEKVRIQMMQYFHSLKSRRNMSISESAQKKREDNSSVTVYLILFNLKTDELSVAHNSEATQLKNVSFYPDQL